MNKDELRKKAEIIRDETKDGANTAERVGGCLVDIVDALPAGGGVRKKDTVLEVNCIGSKNSRVNVLPDGNRPNAGYLLCAYVRGFAYGAVMANFFTYAEGGGEDEDAPAKRESARNGEIYILGKDGRYKHFGYAHEYKEVRSSAKVVSVNCSQQRWEGGDLDYMRADDKAAPFVRFEKINNGGLYYPFLEYRKRTGRVGLLAVPNFRIGEDGMTNGVRTVEEACECVKQMLDYERDGVESEHLKDFVNFLKSKAVGFGEFVDFFNGQTNEKKNTAAVMKGGHKTHGGAMMRSGKNHAENWRWVRYPYIKVVFMQCRKSRSATVAFGNNESGNNVGFEYRRRPMGEPLCEFANNKLRKSTKA